MRLPTWYGKIGSAAFAWFGPVLCLIGALSSMFTGDWLASYWALVAMCACVYIVSSDARRRRIANMREIDAPVGADLPERLEHYAQVEYLRDYGRLGSLAIGGSPETMLEAADHIRRLRKRFGT